MSGFWTSEPAVLITGSSGMGRWLGRSAQLRINFQPERALAADVNEDLTFEFVGE
jgi:hypothetical protein